jgi:hypothetical protein
MFLPAYNKRPPYKKWAGQPAIAGPILLWAQKLADVKFAFPVDVSQVGYPRSNQTEETPSTQTPPTRESQMQ